MKKIIVYCLFVYCLVSLNTAIGETTHNDYPVSIKDGLTYPEGYDIDKYINKMSETIQLGQLNFTLIESTADPFMLNTNIMCQCIDSEAELREWDGFYYELEEILTHVHEAEDHHIYYISISPASPFSEDLFDSIVEKNILYHWSRCYTYDGDVNKHQNSLSNIKEFFLIDIVELYEEKWQRTSYQISYDIDVWPIIDYFESGGFIQYPVYDLEVEYGVYLSPIYVHIVRNYQSLTGEKMNYHFFIKGEGGESITFSDRLSNSFLLLIKDAESMETVYSEKWIRMDDVYVLDKTETKLPT